MKIKTFARRGGTGEIIEVTEGLFTYVAVDGEGKSRPVPLDKQLGTQGGKADIEFRRRYVRFLAQSGHFATEFQCLLLGVKQTSGEAASMSAFDPNRT